MHAKYKAPRRSDFPQPILVTMNPSPGCSPYENLALHSSAARLDAQSLDAMQAGPLHVAPDADLGRWMYCVYCLAPMITFRLAQNSPEDSRRLIATILKLADHHE